VRERHGPDTLRAVLRLASLQRATLVALGLAVTLTTGCPPSFEGLQIVGDPDGSVPRADAFIPLVDGGRAAGGPCGFPQLLVTVENFDSPPGRVLRFELDAYPATTAHRCGDLTGAGRMVQQPWTAVRAPDGRVIVAGDDAVQAVDGETDALTTLVMASEIPHRPSDSFLLRAPDGSTRIAIAFTAFSTSNDIRDLWTLAGGAVVDRWTLGSGTLPLGIAVKSMTASPINPGRLLAVRSDMYAAVEVDPWASMRFDMPPYVAPRDGVVLSTISALNDGTTNRVAWVGSQDGREGAYAITDSTGAGDLRVPLPYRCDETMCDSFAHAVPDPTEYHRVIAICTTNGPPSVSKVVRFSTTGNPCEVLIDDTRVVRGGRLRFSHLAMTVGP